MRTNESQVQVCVSRKLGECSGRASLLVSYRKHLYAVTAYGTASWPTTLHTSELMGLPMSPTMKPVRFGMLYSNGNEVTRFYSTPRCAVAQTGDYAICSTDWTYWNSNADGSPGYGGFGDTNGNETCDPSLNPNGTGTAACRVDVVLYELR